MRKESRNGAVERRLADGEWAVAAYLDIGETLQKGVDALVTDCFYCQRSVTDSFYCRGTEKMGQQARTSASYAGIKPDRRGCGAAMAPLLQSDSCVGTFGLKPTWAIVQLGQPYPLHSRFSIIKTCSVL
jgi:hypothetical protein